MYPTSSGLGGKRDNAGQTILLPGAAFVEAPCPCVLFEEPEVDLRRAKASRDLERTKRGVRPRRPLPHHCREDVEPIEPVKVNSRDTPTGSSARSADHNPRRGRIRKRPYPALVYYLAGKRKALQREGVCEGRNRDMLLELGK